MKTLILMRHSHAESDGSAPTDFERELTDSGRTLARQTADLLIEYKIDMIVSSSAVRTTQTAEIVRQAITGAGGNRTVPLILDDALYLASPSTYDAVIRSEPTEADDVLLIVGHNPGIAILVNALARHHYSFSPASVAVFELQIESWPDFCLSTNALAILKGYIADGAHAPVRTS